MKRTVKCNVRDYPKRSMFMRATIEVDAKDDAEALMLAELEGKLKWPGGKIKAYDIDRIAGDYVPKANAVLQGDEPKRPILSLKAAS